MRLALLLCALLLAGCTASPPAPVPEASPYAPEPTSDVKALSPQEMDDYLNGRGMGYAKAAELNSYPGPLHALDMAAHLGLSEGQKRDIERVRQEMLAEAVPLGQRIVDLERQLDRAFASGSASEDEVAALTLQIGQIEGELRAAHLRAHIVTRGLMTPQQVERYDAMRGYAGEGGHEHGG